MHLGYGINIVIYMQLREVSQRKELLMFNFVKLSSVLLLATLIGCSPNIEKIAENPPASGTFEQALFDNYLVLATMERDEYDRRDANRFADRASMYGQPS